MPEKWSYSAGPHGCSVRVRERTRGGSVYLSWYDPERGKQKESLGFPVRDAEGDLIPEAVNEAQAEAMEAANDRIRGKVPGGENPTTLGELFDQFRERKIPALDAGERRRQAVRRALTCAENVLGRDREVEDLKESDLDRLRRARATGRVDAYGRPVPDENERRPVKARVQKKPLQVLRQACKFGVGEKMISGDPTRGYDLPRESDPHQPVVSDERFAAMLKKAPQHRVGHGEEKDRSPIYELLCIAGDLGRRIGSITGLRCSDWMPDHEETRFGALRWRAEFDKTDSTSVTPVTPRIRDALQDYLRRNPRVGEAWLFPAPEAGGRLRSDTAIKWFHEVEKLADLEPVKGLGFHGLRRRWADLVKSASAVDAAALVGVDPDTLQGIYQRSDMSSKEGILLEEVAGR